MKSSSFYIKIEKGHEALREFHDFFKELDFFAYENGYSHDYPYRFIYPTGDQGGDSTPQKGKDIFEPMPLIFYTFANTQGDK